MRISRNIPAYFPVSLLNPQWQWVAPRSSGLYGLPPWSASGGAEQRAASLFPTRSGELRASTSWQQHTGWRQVLGWVPEQFSCSHFWNTECCLSSDKFLIKHATAFVNVITMYGSISGFSAVSGVCVHPGQQQRWAASSLTEWPGRV